VNKKSRKVFRYAALSYRQRIDSKAAPQFVLFHAPAGEILGWADIERTAPNTPYGAQRPLRLLKVNKIARFFKAENKNTIPTAIIVALDESAVKINSSQRTIEILVDEDRKPGLIIDGQHRVRGATAHSKLLNLNVVAFIGGDEAERAFQFVVINNTATRVSRDHIKALNLNFDEERLNNRLLASAGLSLGLDSPSREDLSVMDTTEPFKGLLKWPRNDDGFIPPNAVEAALAETRDRAVRLEIVDLERDVFLSIWGIIKQIRKNEWNDESHLLEKVGIHALTVYILDSLMAAQQVNDSPLDLTDEDDLTPAVERLVKRIPAVFWRMPWKATELDTKSGRQLLIEALQTIASNVRYERDWYDGVELIDVSLLTEFESAQTAPKKRPRGKKK
jgi:DGQHR domain-containing protein